MCLVLNKKVAHILLNRDKCSDAIEQYQYTTRKRKITGSKAIMTAKQRTGSIIEGCLPSRAWKRRDLNMRMTRSMAARSCLSWGEVNLAWYSSSSSRARWASVTQKNKTKITNYYNQLQSIVISSNHINVGSFFSHHGSKFENKSSFLWPTIYKWMNDWIDGDPTVFFVTTDRHLRSNTPRPPFENLSSYISFLRITWNMNNTQLRFNVAAEMGLNQYKSSQLHWEILWNKYSFNYYDLTACTTFGLKRLKNQSTDIQLSGLFTAQCLQ